MGLSTRDSNIRGSKSDRDILLQSMSLNTSVNPAISGKEDDQAIQENGRHQKESNIRKVEWKALFTFTTKAHLPVLFLGILSSVVGGLTIPVQAILYGLLFNQFANFGSGRISGSIFVDNVSKYCIYTTALGVVSWVAGACYLGFWFAFGELQARSARDKIFNNLLKKDMTWYDLRQDGIGAYLPRIQMQIREFQLATSQPMGESVQSMVTFLSSLGIALYFSWNLTLVTICSVPIVLVFMGLLSNRRAPNIQQQREKLQEALKYLTNTIQGIEMIKCFNGEGPELKRYTQVIKRAAKSYLRQANLQSFQMGFMQFVTLGMFVQGFWYGSSLISSGKRNSGQVLTTFWAALMAVQAITAFLPQVIIMEKGRVAGTDLRLLLVQTQEDNRIRGLMGAGKPSYCAGDVELKKVSFAYPTRPNDFALQDASLFFPAGDTTFVIGRSGSGKSTIGQLLIRFYEQSAGDICIGGQQIETLDVSWLRDNITLVEQHSVLFNDTMYGNIALARSKHGKATAQDVQNAVGFALLQQMVNDLPHGLNTAVGSKGSTMSGGQRQRMALARAWLRDTPILILDESTSALDYITRSVMLDSVRSWRRGKTTIVITHDISQILPNDYMFILDKSKVVQNGYRKDLENDKDSPFHTFVTSAEDYEHEVDATDSPEHGVRIASKRLHEKCHTPPEHLGREYRRQSKPVDPSDTELEVRRDSTHLPLPSQRDSFVSQIASPYWRYALDSADRYGTKHLSLASLECPERPYSLFNNSELPNQEPVTIGRDFTFNSSAKRDATTSVRHVLSVHNTQEVQTQPDKIPRLLRSGKMMSRHHLRPRATDHALERTKSLSMLQILRTVWPKLDWLSRLTLISAFLAASIHSAATPLFAYVFSKLLSTFYISENRDEFALLYSLCILGIAIIDGLATYIFHVLFEYCAQVWVNNTKVEAMRHLLDQPREFFDREENNVSRLAECMDHFAEETRNVLGRFAGIVFVVLVMLAITLIWSLITCWKLTLVALATAPVLYAITASFKAISSKWEVHANNADETIGTIFHETFVNIRTVRCLTLEIAFHKKFTRATNNALKTGLKRCIYCGTFFGLNYSAVFFLTALLFWYGATLVASGEFETTDIVQTFNLLLMSTSYVNSIISFIPQMGHAKDAAARLLRLASLPRNSHEHKGTVHLSMVGDITLRNFSFSYPSRTNETVLRKVDLKILAGSCTAIVGPSGSGKSTIASLLLKLYEARSGFAISGYELSEMHTATLRSHIAAVSQTPVLFPGTIAENIAYGLSSLSPYASSDSIRSAASAAGIDAFIESLPSGYNTIIGEGGTGISGGQAQRIAIARALVRKPSILILDEATSALDAESASMIRETVRNLVADSHLQFEATSQPTSDRSGRERPMVDRHAMTVIIITHAKEMMAVANHIIMLDKGEVIESGTFEELKRKQGKFARLLQGDE